MKILGTIVRAVLLAGLAGCGSGAPTTFPHQLVAADGRPIVLDEVETIVNDTALSEDEKREQLRELGIEDEELIDALLTL
jgi:predicted small lipoprotein YifL